MPSERPRELLLKLGNPVAVAKAADPYRQRTRERLRAAGEETEHTCATMAFHFAQIIRADDPAATPKLVGGHALLRGGAEPLAHVWVVLGEQHLDVDWEEADSAEYVSRVPPVAVTSLEAAEGLLTLAIKALDSVGITGFSHRPR